MANVFNPGELVISVYGDGNNDGTYTDNQASPIVLEDVSTSGTVGAKLVLPQTATTVNGVTQNAISGEYGSSSEGTLQLSADGKSLTIAGYAVNAATYNTAEAAGGSNIYGNAALAQSTSVPGGASTPVARVIADIRADGTVDTSTALFNVDNTNNPRSAVTNDGSSFYIAGQGVKNDTTQGLFYALDGASSATAINTATDQRTVEISNGNLYASTDSKQGAGGAKFTANIAQYTGEPTAAATPTILPGISQSVTLTAAQTNGVNNAQVGKAVDLSLENYVFANSTTLYVADGGQPKGGGLGDGGLQKWTLSNGTWTLDYTLSAGLNLVANTATSGTTGLIGLTGQVVGGNVNLYATNSTIGDLDQTYLYGITDSLAATTMPTGETFTPLVTAAADTNIRGVAFAPVCFASGTLIRTERGGREVDVAVETLAVSDLAVTASGARRPVRWIGHRRLDGRQDGGVLPHDQQPIRIRAGAFGRDALGSDLPRRDLLLSPGHPVLVGADADGEGGVLVPVMCLVNGTTVERMPVASVTYWHVELDAHDILLAEGLPAESYLDWGDRAFFTQANHDALANPDFVVPGLAGRCRPVAVDGPVVEAKRRRLDAVFVMTLAGQAAWAGRDGFDAA